MLAKIAWKSHGGDHYRGVVEGDGRVDVQFVIRPCTITRRFVLWRKHSHEPTTEVFFDRDYMMASYDTVRGAKGAARTELRSIVSRLDRG